MRLVREIPRAVFDVLAIDGAGCVWVALENIDDDSADEMRTYLRAVTRNGPDRFNRNRCRHLRGDIYEFKEGQLRVLWFWNPNPTEGRIVLTHLVRKKRRKADPDEISHAETVRKRYLEARRTNQLEIVERPRK